MLNINSLTLRCVREPSGTAEKRMHSHCALPESRIAVVAPNSLQSV